MKTILYNPIFINPQAYYVFPRLTRYLQPDNESTSEPANYIGTIEVKVIAYGDTTLKRTYTNTDSIDLSEFKNTWIRISLFTKVGSCVLGEWKIGNMESDLPYIDPEVLASLKAVVIVGNKTNNDSDRAIVKNLVDPDNPFVISNAAYTEGSGYADKGSPYYGAFVTDGVDDLITSTKTVQEMLGGSNEITVVSMMANLDSRQILCNSNYSNTNGYNVRNTLEPNGVISMLGYTDKNGTTNNINLIMGDKNSIKLVDKVNFNSDYVFYPAQYYKGYYQVAWYWTIIANKVLTTDQINQVIAYFNLDRTLKPDILCNVKKQGITNENHAEFGDRLIDFSGNGRDIQLNNIAWKGDSGIGKYETDFLDSNIWNHKTNSIVTSDKIVCDKASTHITLLYYSVRDENKYDVPSFSVLKQGDDSEYYYIDEQGVRRTFKLLDGINILPASHNTLFTGTEVTCGFGNPGIGNSVTITQIPSHAGALCLDGVNDFGKVTGMPVYKDYTIIADYERFYLEPITGGRASILSKSSKVGDGSFIFNLEDQNGDKACYTFGEANGNISDDITRIIRYQSKYYNTKTLSIGTAEDNDFMVLGKVREVDNRYFYGAIYSLMSFPYSMSEFLIERQLKKHKLGTLYPDMVEFRPVIKSNASYDNIVFYYKNEKVENGTYLTVGSSIGMHIRLSSNPVNEIKSITINGIPATFKFHDANNNIYQYDFNLTSKSPQKIDITIDEYIRYEDIVQPYPVIFQIKDRNTNQRYSWGDKIKVGSSIQLFQSENPNLLSGLYSIKSYEYEGKMYGYNQLTNLNIILTKQSISLSCNKIWLLDDNEPKCILSPSRLRIPNSSYKILGYIPDISGHGNHGKINNSAYAGMSGVNGYPVVFGANKTWANESNGYVTSITSNTIHITNVLNAGLALLYSYVKYNGNLQNIKEIPPFKIEIKGLEGRSKIIYKYLATSDATKETNLYLGNGTHELPKSFLPTEALINNAVVGFSISPIEEGVTNFLSDITIKVLPEYEGAYCLDGVDDFVTIPTTVGGKQVLMKVNWDSPNASILYDQRGYDNEFAIYNSTNDSDGNPIPAYQGRNNGQTYIDGILNSNIKASELRAITHNITITNELSSGANKTYPIIGSSKSNAYFVNMALYDFMLFDEISTDDKILELNEYVGIEGNTE